MDIHARSGRVPCLRLVVSVALPPDVSVTSLGPGHSGPRKYSANEGLGMRETAWNFLVIRISLRAAGQAASKYQSVSIILFAPCSEDEEIPNAVTLLRAEAQRGLSSLFRYFESSSSIFVTPLPSRLTGHICFSASCSVGDSVRAMGI
ncbi:hypothetical protein CIHG_03686 [Coccidioides immitis H538.4]|uniref:Uncharacterized protein n=2 Tax=Coccidioides immitis TaxID=5501 RepID=A0A0J8RKI7_COCIT|nr:hypothetical protein CIRG_04874 [Coccidioides immitis RMSCC 2394]KMU85645.1 hypothetical protein CIHG_03686 [Coccidioides immitis H538.4]